MNEFSKLMTESINENTKNIDKMSSFKMRNSTSLECLHILYLNLHIFKQQNGSLT